MGYALERAQSHKLVFRLGGPPSTNASPEESLFLSLRVVAGSPDRAHCRPSPSIPSYWGDQVCIFVVEAVVAVRNPSAGFPSDYCKREAFSAVTADSTAPVSHATSSLEFMVVAD